MDFNFLYKARHEDTASLSQAQDFDILISSYNKSDRLLSTYQGIRADRKIWIIHPEYNFNHDDLPSNQEYFLFEQDLSESENIRKFFSESFPEGNTALREAKVAIDCTGMMRPDLLFLILYLQTAIQLSRFDIFYSEPKRYIDNDETKFSTDTTGKVKVIEGFDLSSHRDHSNDLLIIASGFDDILIAEVAEARKSAKKIQIIGFPSLQADMYQQNILRSSKATDVDGEDTTKIYFAPASDPFETANTLYKIISDEENKKPITNLYLSPLSTKAQTVGFAIFYINECILGEREASIIIPEMTGYSEKTSEGIDHIWQYTIEFPDQ